MHTYLHLLRIYARRFWREIAAFWIISGSASWLSLRGAGQYPPAGFAILELLALTFAAVRLMQAETVFATLGGWQVRPVGRSILRGARWTLFALLLLPAAAARLKVTAMSFSLSPEEWYIVMRAVWVPLLSGVTTGALASAWIGRDGRFGPEHRYPALVWGLILCSGSALAGWGFSNSGQQTWGQSSSSGGSLAFLPAGSPDISDGLPKSLNSAQPLFHLPLRAGATMDNGACRAVVSECAPTGTRVAAVLEIDIPARPLMPWVPSSQAYHAYRIFIRYADGSWAPNGNPSETIHGSMLAGLPATRYTFSGVFASPLMLPENLRTREQLWEGAEIFFFAVTPAGTAKPSPVTPIQAPVRTEGVPLQTEAAKEVAALLNEDATQGFEQRLSVIQKLIAMGDTAVEPLLRESWGQYLWQDVGYPALDKLLTEKHLPLLLDALKSRPRLGELAVSKGWTQQALPILRAHLLNGLPLGQNSLRALLQTKDPALAAALTNELRCTPSGDSGVLQLAREFPGIDWPALAGSAWERHAFLASDMHQNGSRPNAWTGLAAAEGHPGAMRELVASWCSRIPEKSRVHHLLDSESWDGDINGLPAWLRANFSRLQWDAAKRLWRLP